MFNNFRRTNLSYSCILCPIRIQEKSWNDLAITLDQFLLRDARSAERGIATLILSVRLSVCPFVSDFEVWGTVVIYRLGYFESTCTNH